MKTVLNIGCGKTYAPEAINIDIDRNVKHDLLLDISDTYSVYELLSVGNYEKIIAHDVLEHIPDLKSAMTNCLNLLQEDGIMDIIVPYDLSYGAWQDPTHLRAFNERSWRYYDEWCWYLGWRDYKLKLQDIEFLMFEKRPQLPIEEMVRTPRHIDAMHVILRKIKI